MNNDQVETRNIRQCHLVIPAGSPIPTTLYNFAAWVNVFTWIQTDIPSRLWLKWLVSRLSCRSIREQTSSYGMPSCSTSGVRLSDYISEIAIDGVDESREQHQNNVGSRKRMFCLDHRPQSTGASGMALPIVGLFIAIFHHGVDRLFFFQQTFIFLMSWKHLTFQPMKKGRSSLCETWNIHHLS